jgi:transcription elongation GreA/GreB family factor
MKIRPIGGEASSRLYTEHRVISATEGAGEDKLAEAERSGAKGPRQMKLFDEATAAEQQFDGVLRPGDRVVIRYLDDERSRPEFYILTDKVNDPKNGLLSLFAPLARALAEASPDDEFTFALEDGRERTVLFMNLERARAA